MQTLMAIKNNGRPGPYQRPVRLRVVDVDIPYTYGKDKQLLNMALADATAVTKAVCFDKEKFTLFSPNNGVVLRNVIIKPDEIVITKQSSVFRCNSVQVTPEIEEQGRTLIHPSTPQIITVAEAKRSPQKQRVSIRARIISDGLKTTRTVKTEEVPFRSITVKDQSDSVKVSLWRENANSDLRPGDHIEITHIVVNNFMNEVQLQTTHFTSIKKVDPPQESKRMEFLGLNVGDITAELMSMDDGVFTVSNDLLISHFDCPLKSLENHFPCELTVQYQESVIVRIH